MEDLAKSYVRGSVFVLPTVEDGFAMVLVQAMAAGLPVIATVNSGGPDLIEEGKQGFLVPIRDVDALKEKLLYLYEHPEERAEMGRAAAARVAQGFTWHDYGDGVIAAYERLLAARH
jgi:glycosyltransferase involved in cell wall biosynthesis